MTGPFLFTEAIVKAEEGRLIPRAGRYTFESSWCLTAGEIPGHRIQVRERTLVARGTGRGESPARRKCASRAVSVPYGGDEPPGGRSQRS